MYYKILELHDENISLRDEKFALTRLSILNKVLLQLEIIPLENLDIEAICNDIKISRRTFFNYFPQKSYIIQFLLSLWVYEISLEFEKIKFKDDGIDLIYKFITLFDNKLKENTNISKELIRQLFNMKFSDLEQIMPLTRTEKLLLGFTPEQELPSPYSFNHIIEYSISVAIENNQLPNKTSINDFCMFVQSLILGTLQIILFNNIKLESSTSFKTIIYRQLKIYINGLNY